MSWRDLLHLDGRGSFRGVEFFVKRSDRTVGRRTVVRQFPGRNVPQFEDLGEQARTGTLEAFLVGPDYMGPRNELLKAFRTAGPGPLVHPYWGRLTIVVTSPVTLQETVEEGGMARFTLSFTEAGEIAEPAEIPDTKQETSTAVDAAAESATNDFEEGWTVEGVTEAVRDAAEVLVSGVNSAVSTLNTVNGQINAALNQVDAVGEAIQALSDQAASLILAPRSLVAAIQDIYTDILQGIYVLDAGWAGYFTDEESPDAVAGDPSTAPTGGTPASGSQRVRLLLSAFRDAVAYGDDLAAVPTGTPSREAEAGNQDSFVQLFQTVATIETCRAAIELPFSSYDQAVEVRDELTEKLDELSETADDESYNALVDLRASVSKHLTRAASVLPRIIPYTPAVTLPALVLAHQIYGDATQEADIIDRNGIRNPCEVGGGIELEVLSDDG